VNWFGCETNTRYPHGLWKLKVRKGGREGGREGGRGRRGKILKLDEKE